MKEALWGLAVTALTAGFAVGYLTARLLLDAGYTH
jgi:hypothetical protein